LKHEPTGSKGPAMIIEGQDCTLCVYSMSHCGESRGHTSNPHADILTTPLWLSPGMPCADSHEITALKSHLAQKAIRNYYSTSNLFPV
jgi:hypothetical protein